MRLEEVEAVIRAWKASGQTGDVNALLKMMRALAQKSSARAPAPLGV